MRGLNHKRFNFQGVFFRAVPISSFEHKKSALTFLTPFSLYDRNNSKRVIKELRRKIHALENSVVIFSFCFFPRIVPTSESNQ
jgi:hypothetical protein